LQRSGEHTKLEADKGFSYRTLLGELIYAYVICCLDIGFAVTFLARCSAAPAPAHFDALKKVCLCLRRTKAWGLMCWRRAPLRSLPFVPFECVVLSEDLPTFPAFDLSDSLGFVDAACGTCPLARRSVVGLLFICAAAAVLHKTRLMSIVATSSTEAEFIAAVFAAKQRQASLLCSPATWLCPGWSYQDLRGQ
jgi:hypothetical protein